MSNWSFLFIAMEDSFRWFPVLDSSDDSVEDDLGVSSGILEDSSCMGWIVPKNFCDDARKSMDIQNAGGNSALSEACSIQYFYDLGYSNFVYEANVIYKSTSYKLVDFVADAPQKYESKYPELVKEDRERVGISVTRACDYGRGFNPTDLLYKKIKGLIGARNNATSSCKFYRSILHIWCSSHEIMQKINETYGKMLECNTFDTPDLKGSLKVVTTYSTDRRIYKNLPVQ